MLLDGDEELGLTSGELIEGFLVFGPHPGGGCFLDVLKRFFLGATLRDASGQGGAFGYDPALFIDGLQGDV